MAERRMFAKTIVLSDAVLDMPMSARCLYFTLGMLADDDGFVGNPKALMRQCGASQDDMAILIQRRFVLAFESGVIVIKHWRMNNLLKNDRYKSTVYIEERSTLALDEKNAYTERVEPNWNQSGSKVEPQDSIGKDSIGEDSITQEKDKKEKVHRYGEYKNVPLSDSQLEKLKAEFPDWQSWIEKVSDYCQRNGKKYSDYLAVIRNWARRDKERNVYQPPTDDLPY